VLVASFHFNISLTPDRVIILIAIAALATGRVRQFLKDWSIFLVVLLAWQVLTGMSRHLGELKPHVTEMIVIDKFLFFGQLPTLWLQEHFHQAGHFAAYNMLLHQRLYVPGPVRWYDVGATVLYMLHFVFPMGFAFVLWVYRREVFVQFMGSFLVVALAGFATFVLFPAAPPWIAANWWHYLPHVERILNDGISVFGGQQSFSALYQWMWDHGGWDLYGAVPSEHAAFPFLCFLYARRTWPRAGWLLLPYCVLVGIAVVYMGEHYVTDVIVGVLYAAVGYAVVQLALSRRAARTQRAPEEAAPVAAVSDTLSA
jgi:membrane-associated phospholipid phosphatase